MVLFNEFFPPEFNLKQQVVMTSFQERKYGLREPKRRRREDDEPPPKPYWKIMQERDELIMKRKADLFELRTEGEGGE